MRTDEDGIAWLLFDKKDASANTLSDETCSPSSTPCWTSSNATVRAGW